jgi:hypothetical protein
MIAFKHAGDLGDIVYSLPVVKSLCKSLGQQAAFLIEAANYTRQMLTPDKWCGINELLMRQPYIADVRPWIKGEPVNFNLNDFRARLFQSLKVGVGKEQHLTHWMCDAHSVNRNCMDEPWLEIGDPIPVAPVIFSRAGAGRPPHQVYQNPSFPWHYVWARYRKEAVFIGTEHEHQIFCATCGEVPHCKTATLLEAARVIAGANLFCGNQTVTHAIAEGLKKKIVLEVWLGGPNCLVFRDGVVHGWDHTVKDKLPEVELPYP